MNSLVQCIYSSTASSSFNEDHIPVLLEQARANNLRNKITGMLIYINGHFLQVLEGEKDVVTGLIATIHADRRHVRFKVLSSEAISRRNFGLWSMGFEALLSSDVGTLVGENDFFESGSCVAALDAGIVKTILDAFRDSKRFAADESALNTRQFSQL